MRLATIFIKELLTVLEAFRIVLVIVFRPIALIANKVFALPTHKPIRENLFDFVFKLSIDNVKWW